MSKVSTNGDIIVDFSVVVPNPEKGETIIPPKAYNSKESKHEMIEFMEKSLSGEGYITKENKEKLRNKRSQTRTAQPKQGRQAGTAQPKQGRQAGDYR